MERIGLFQSPHAFPLSSSIQFDEDRQGYCLSLSRQFAHEPSAAGGQNL